MLMQTTLIFFQGLALVLLGFGLGALLVYLYYNYSSSSETTSLKNMPNVSFVEVSISERELEDLLRDIESWDRKRLERFLSNFLLEREISILRTLAMAFIVDGKSDYSLLNNLSKGWMNKYQISLKSGVSKKVIYKRGGVMERLISLKLLHTTRSGIWGGSTIKYRLNTENDFIITYAKAVLDAHPK